MSIMKVILFFLFLIQVAMAQDPGIDPACKEARTYFCKDQQWTHEYRYCLLKYEKSLLEGDCRKMVEGLRIKYAPVIKICREQIWKHCENFPQNLQGCLKVNKDQFTGDCGKAVRDLK